MTSLHVLKTTRIVLFLTIIGGFVTSIYLLPLILSFACESTASSQVECLGKGTSIIFFHLFAPLFFYFQLEHTFNKTTILFGLYGCLMLGMYFISGLLSLLLGLFFLSSATLFFFLRNIPVSFNVKFIKDQ